MNSGNYLLNFVIPQGPTGPTGAAFVPAYGGKYSNTGASLSLGLGTQTQVPLSISMPSLNTSYVTSNSITVSQTGIYEINFYMNASAALSTTLTLAVRVNGTNIPATVISRGLSVGTNTIYSGSIITSLTAGNVIDMAISALIAVGITLGSGNNASLTIKKLS